MLIQQIFHNFIVSKYNKMDDFGSIIYIVFTIIAIVFSIMRKSNQKAKPTPPSVPTGSGDPFDEALPTFENIFGGENKNPVPEPVVATEPVKKKEVVNSFEEKKREINSRFSRIKKDTPLKEETVNEIYEEKENWFNLRKAVIYSEILKRPNL